MSIVRMDGKFSESVAALKCSGKFRFSPGPIAIALREDLTRHGFALDKVQFVDTTEVLLYGEGGILSVCLIDEFEHDILIAAETPVTEDDAPEVDKVRLLLCATATRVMCELVPVESISWWHGGAYHVTRQGRNFAPLLARRKPNKDDPKGIRAALSAVTEGVRRQEGRLGTMMRRHFPSASDVALASDPLA